MRKRNCCPQPDQLTLFSISEYERQITEASIDCAGWEPESTPVVRENVKRVYFPEEECSPENDPNESTPVVREIVERVYFWVETYIMRGRYLHYRFCHLRNVDGIRQVVKLHIGGSNRSIREGRAQVIREAIASGKSPQEIESLIQGWRV